MAFQLLVRVVKRRIQNGEALETVLADYPKLTESEKNLLRQTCQ